MRAGDEGPAMSARQPIVLPYEGPGNEIACWQLYGGGVVVIPTDTVYGMAVALSCEEAIKRLFQIKGRPEDRAIVLLVNAIEQAASVGALSPAALVLAERFWPGPLTLVLQQAPDAHLPAALTGGRSTVGVRLPDHPCPRFLAEALGPLPVTSANLSGQPETLDVMSAVRQLGDRISLFLDGGPARGGVPSTVVDCSAEPPRILRAGAIEPDRLAAALEEAGLAHSIEG
jgi:L-threonylcarbamoyladenylate synthase